MRTVREACADPPPLPANRAEATWEVAAAADARRTAGSHFVKAGAKFAGGGGAAWGGRVGILPQMQCAARHIAIRWRVKGVKEWRG